MKGEIKRLMAKDSQNEVTNAFGVHPSTVSPLALVPDYGNILGCPWGTYTLLMIKSSTNVSVKFLMIESEIT